MTYFIHTLSIAEWIVEVMERDWTYLSCVSILLRHHNDCSHIIFCRHFPYSKSNSQSQHSPEKLSEIRLPPTNSSQTPFWHIPSRLVIGDRRLIGIVRNSIVSLTLPEYHIIYTLLSWLNSTVFLPFWIEWDTLYNHREIAFQLRNEQKWRD